MRFPDPAKRVWNKPGVAADVAKAHGNGQHDLLGKVHCFGDLSSVAANFRYR